MNAIGKIIDEEVEKLPYNLKVRTKKRLLVLKLESWERKKPLTMELVREFYLTVIAEGKK